VLTYGIGFISLMFLGFLSGFMVGQYYFKYEFKDCMILSLVVGIATLLLETVLMILRIEKMDRAKAAQKRRRYDPNAASSVASTEADILASIGQHDVQTEQLVPEQKAKEVKYEKRVTLNPKNIKSVKKSQVRDGDKATGAGSSTSKSAKAKKND